MNKVPINNSKLFKIFVLFMSRKNTGINFKERL